MLLNWNIYFIYWFYFYQINLVSELHDIRYWYRYRYSYCMCFSLFQNYEMFSEAVEADTVEQFLKIAWEPNLVASNILFPSLVHVHIPKGRPACSPLLRWRCLPYMSQCHATCQKNNNRRAHTYSVPWKYLPSIWDTVTHLLLYAFVLIILFISSRVLFGSDA